MTSHHGKPRILTQRGVPLPRTLDEQMIHAVVHGFYDRVRRDALIGPVFEARIAPDQWPAHLQRMCDFWSATLLRTERYGGRPLPPHLAISELDDAHFDRWLTLFHETLEECCDPASRDIFLDFAFRVARSFRMALRFHRGEDTTDLPPLAIEAAFQ